MANITVAIDPKKILAFLFSINLLLVLIYIGHYLVFNYAPTRVFDLDVESNIPTWYSSAQLLAISLALISIYIAQPKNVLYKTTIFLLASIAFLFLSIDEVVELHEKFNTIAFGLWIVIYMTLCSATLIILRKEIVSVWLQNNKAIYIGLAGAFFYLLAMACEYLGFSYYGDTYWSKADKPLGYILEVAFEEFFEMSGHSLILYGVMQLFSDEQAIC